MCSINLLTATNGSAKLTKDGLEIFSQIVKPGSVYMEAALIMTGVIPTSQVTVNLFDAGGCERLNAISRIMDQINTRYGRTR